MFKVIIEDLNEGEIRYRISKNEDLISYTDWINLIESSEVFILFFSGILKSSNYKAYFWEVKPTNIYGLDDVFEFVLVMSKSLLKIKADESSFISYFEKGKEVISFPNLRGDAQLVVPTPIIEKKSYSHLANFVRMAPESQVIRFWKKVGKEYANKIDEKPIWLSTAGLGVHWLHVRIDSKPKYYRFKEYKNEV